MNLSIIMQNIIEIKIEINVLCIVWCFCIIIIILIIFMNSDAAIVEIKAVDSNPILFGSR